ncbi:hypothetical protein J6590_022662 [Homalodisca vitripennis]|nr:hypothetical protein J6590_022662 [Homalodisca vitripennis]
MIVERLRVRLLGGGGAVTVGVVFDDVINRSIIITYMYSEPHIDGLHFRIIVAVRPFNTAARRVNLIYRTARHDNSQGWSLSLAKGQRFITGHPRRVTVLAHHLACRGGVVLQ